MKATGVATSPPYNLDKNTEDTITLMTEWLNLESKHVGKFTSFAPRPLFCCSSISYLMFFVGTAVYTASWISAKSDVHSQQRFFYQGHKGEVTIDQAHRGYFLASDVSGFASLNPLYMKYTTDAHGMLSLSSSLC